MKNRFHGAAPSQGRQAIEAFTLVELLVVISIVGLLSSLLLPALARAKGKGQAIFCLNNLKQLELGWLIYAHDNNDRLVFNFGATEINQFLALRQTNNWACSVLNWELDAGNTNALLNTAAALGPFVGQNARVYGCPRDNVLSTLQKRAGWSGRSRSISLNAMVGDAGQFTKDGSNVNNPSYRQYLKLGDFTAPTDIFVFIEEHPDSINDGYFLNRATTGRWTDLPASYHNGGANLTFADGHAEFHYWTLLSTKPSAEPDAAGLPFALNPNDRADFLWLLRRTSEYDESSD